MVVNNLSISAGFTTPSFLLTVICIVLIKPLNIFNIRPSSNGKLITGVPDNNTSFKFLARIINSYILGLLNPEPNIPDVKL